MKQIKLNDEFLLVDGYVAKGDIKYQDKIYYYFCTLRQHGNRVLSPFFEDLAKIKGIYLYENPYSVYDMSTWHNVDKEKQEAEEKTFYNPLIFKI